MYCHKYDMRYEISPIYKNRVGDTIAMFACKYFHDFNDTIPSYMYHDPYIIKNKYNESLMDIIKSKPFYGRLDELQQFFDTFNT